MFCDKEARKNGVLPFRSLDSIFAPWLNKNLTDFKSPKRQAQ